MSIEKLERAREALEDKPSQALKLLPRASSLPVFLRPERNFIAAEAWRAMGYFERAERLYRTVLSHCVSVEDPPLWIEAALGSAAGLRSIGAVREAIRRIRRAETLSRSEGLSVFAIRLALEKALIERAAGRYRASLRMFKPLLEAAVRRKDDAQSAFLLWAIGGAQRFSGNLKGSEASFRRSRSLARKAGDRVGEGYALFGLGGVTRILGRLTEAAGFYARAGRVFRLTDDHFAQAYAYCGYANALRQLGRYKEAAKHYRRSHRLYSRIGDAVDLAYVDWGLGEVRLHQGQTRHAIPFFRKALAAFRKYREARGEVLSAISLAQCLHVQGHTAEAERLFEDAYKLSRRAGLHAHIEPFT